MQPIALLSVLDDYLTSAIITALGANAVIHHCCAAVRASRKCRDGSEIVSTTLVSSLLGEFVFRMCHS